jgi:hypothetical protein
VGVLEAVFGLVLSSNPEPRLDPVAYQFLVAAVLYIGCGVWLLGGSRVAYGVSVGLSVVGLLLSTVAALIGGSEPDMWKLIDIAIAGLPVIVLLSPPSLRWARREGYS